jgi:hypothetical protein
MALLSDYSAGTITIEADGLAVTGSGTAWLAAGFGEGDLLIANGYFGLVGSVQSNTALTLAQSWRGGALSGAAYRLRYQGDGSRISAQARQLIELLGGSGNLESLGKLTAVANQMPYFSGAGQMAATPLTAFARSLLDDADAAAVLSTLGVSTFIKSLLDDADASAALTTLGVSTFIKSLLDDADASAALTTLGVSDFIKALLDDADATAARATLGLDALLNGKLSLTGGTITGSMTVQSDSGFPLVLVKPDNGFYGKALRLQTGDGASTGKGNGPQINFIKYNRAQWGAGIQHGDENGSSFVINYDSHELQNGTTMLRIDPDGRITITGNLFIGSAWYQNDGNIFGSAWEIWGYGYSDAFSAIQHRIEVRAGEFADDRVSRLLYRLVSPAAFDPGDHQVPSGAVVTGIDTDASTGRVYRTWYRYLQAYDPVKGWLGFFNA